MCGDRPVVMIDVTKTAQRYFSRGLELTATLYIIGVILAIANVIRFGWALEVSAAFSLTTLVMYGFGWKYIADNFPGSLSLFYMGGSVLRILLALPFILVCNMLVPTYDEFLTYAVTFIIFYLVMLAYDAVYFARVEKNK